MYKKPIFAYSLDAQPSDGLSQKWCALSENEGDGWKIEKVWAAEFILLSSAFLFDDFISLVSKFKKKPKLLKTKSENPIRLRFKITENIANQSTLLFIKN